MEEIKTQKELSKIMSKLYEQKNNKWYKSKLFPDLYFWNTEGKENSLTFPVIYTKLELLKKVAMKMFGYEGFISK